MSDCPFCDTNLIELYSKETVTSTDYSFSYYPSYQVYGHWCSKCQQMFEMKTKTWFKPIQSCKEKVKNE